MRASVLFCTFITICACFHLLQEGNTALHLAAESGHEHVAKLLMEGVADVKVVEKASGAVARSTLSALSALSALFPSDLSAVVYCWGL